jgi:hypothetical protein
MSKHELAIRLDTLRADALPKINKIQKYLKPDKFLWSFELGSQTEKPHIHGYILKNGANYESKELDAVRKWFLRHFKGLYSCCPVRNVDNYKNYTVKDLDILTTNLDEEEIDELIERAQEIAEDKKRSKVDKIFNYVRDKLNIHFSDDYEKMDTPDDETISNLIVEWHLERNLVFNHNQILSYFNNIKSRLTLEGKKQVKRSIWLYINKYNQ